MSHVIFDLDGTLADCTHRVHLAQAKQWDEFHANGRADKLIFPSAVLMWSLERTHKCLIVTGRTEAFRMQTVQWLLSNHLRPEALLMRPNGDYRKDADMKLGLIDEYFGSRQRALETVLACVEDRDQMAEAYRNAGFTCWQVAQGTY